MKTSTLLHIMACGILLTSCHGTGSQGNASDAAFSYIGPSTMDPDFDPMQKHPIAQRTAQATGQVLDVAAMVMHGDTLGDVLLLRNVEMDDYNRLLLEADVTPLAADSASRQAIDSLMGHIAFTYNIANGEVAQVTYSDATTQIYSQVDWDEDGNISLITRTHIEHTPQGVRQTAETYTYSYSTLSANGNWYTGIPALLCGPAEALCYTGFTGRAPWTLPTSVTVISSTIEDGRIAAQSEVTTAICYTLNQNRLVVSQQFQLGETPLSFSYTY